jgi:hypothetical protein
MANSDLAMADIYPEDSGNEAECSVVIGGERYSDSNSDSDDSGPIDSEAEGFKTPPTNWKQVKMMQDGVTKSYWFNEVTGKSLLAPPHHNAKYTPPSKKNKYISTTDSFITRSPNLSRGGVIDYVEFSNETHGCPVPVSVASHATSAIELTSQVSEKMVLHSVSGLATRAK